MVSDARSCCGLVTADLAEERLCLDHEGALLIRTGPDRPEEPTGFQYPSDLAQGGTRLHPVPRRRRQHRVGDPVVDRQGLPSSLEHGGSDDFAGQNGAHPLVGFYRDHPIGPIDQQPSQRPGSRPEIDDGVRTLWEEPVHRVGRRARTVPLVLGGGLAEAVRAPALDLG